MKNKTIKFNLSPEFCFEKAEQYYEEGDFVLSLSYLERMQEEKLSKELFEEYCYLRAQICHVFGTEAGNFWAFKYCAKHGYSERLAPMIAYATIENDALLNEYKKNDLPEFLQEFMSSIEGVEGVEDVEFSELPTVPQERKLMFTTDMLAQNAIKEGDELMKAGKFEEAITKFKQVAVAAKQYGESLSDIALCHLFLGNYKKSYEINKMVLENFPKNLQSMLQMLSLCGILEKGEEFKKYLEIVQGMKHTPSDSIKVANILIDAKQYQLAIPHFEFAFDSLNYSLEGYVTYIVTLYNAGKQKRGEIEMKEILKFFPDNAVLRHILSQMDGREAVSYDVIFSESNAECLEKGIKILTQKNFSESTFESHKNLAYMKYACGKSNQALEYFDKILKFKNGEKMFCEMLYHPATSTVQRANILRYLMKNEYKGRVLFRGGTFKYLKISYPTCVKDSQLVFIAYAFAFSTLAYFQSDFEPQLKRAITAFVKTCAKKEIDIETIFTPDMVSALVLAKMKKLSFDIICEFSNVEKKKFLYLGYVIYGEKFKTFDEVEV